MKENLLISACLLGMPTRYDGKSKVYPKIELLREKYNLIPICPEVMGGLPTPRTPSERVGEKVLMQDGRDVTENFRKGAELSLSVAQVRGAKIALLKERSPSCGRGRIYDGSFTKTEINGDGVTAELLSEYGIEIFTESNIDKLLSRDNSPLVKKT